MRLLTDTNFNRSYLGGSSKFNAEMRLTDLNPIYVSVNDFASGGCWTNLKEVKTYASDKLELGGGVLTDSLEEVLKVMHMRLTF